jgi:hypothetical protein
MNGSGESIRKYGGWGTLVQAKKGKRLQPLRASPYIHEPQYRK